MAFRKSFSPAMRRKQPKESVFGVGSRVFVHWPGETSNAVPATDRHGGPLDNDLADGQELEILSWHPRSSLGLIYEVRRLLDDRQWWVAAPHLRAVGTRQAAASVVAG